MFEVGSLPTIHLIRAKQPRLSSMIQEAVDLDSYRGEILRNRKAGGLLIFEFYESERLSLRLVLVHISHVKSLCIQFEVF